MTAAVSSYNFIYNYEKDLYEKIQLAMRDQNPLKHCDEVFFRKQLTTYYFHQKVISQIFDMVLNAEASPKDVL